MTGYRATRQVPEGIVLNKIVIECQLLPGRAPAS
jgi:hypothetical protein